MVREIRLFLYFLIGVLLSAIACFSYAETISATGPATVPAASTYGYTGAQYADTAGTGYATPLSAAQAWYSAVHPTFATKVSGPYVWPCSGTNFVVGSLLSYQVKGSGDPFCSYTGATITVAYTCSSGNLYGSNCTNAYTCPSGQGWSLTGSTCTRPDCASGEVRQPDGTCSNPNACKLSANAQIGTGNYQFPRPQPSGVTWCIDHCQAYQGVEVWHTPTLTYAPAYVNGAGGAASTCESSGSNTPVPTTEEPSKTNPPCGAGQGTATMGGKVVCVDTSKVPTAEAPPDVKKTTTTKTESDGSTTTITEIRTCTGEGACSTTTITTIGATPSGTPGTAGIPGTSTAVKDTGSNETADFCKSNPNMQICKGGMATETTLTETRDEIKKLTKSEELSDEAITGKATFNSGDDAALKAQNEDLTARVTGGVFPDGVQINKGSWEAAMTGGWFDEIPNAGCSPAVISAAGRSITLDWCERAAQISQMGAYALWFTLLVGVFVMLTGGKRGD